LSGGVDGEDVGVVGMPEEGVRVGSGGGVGTVGAEGEGGDKGEADPLPMDGNGEGTSVDLILIRTVDGIGTELDPVLIAGGFDTEGEAVHIVDILRAVSEGELDFGDGRKLGEHEARPGDVSAAGIINRSLKGDVSVGVNPAVFDGITDAPLGVADVFGEGGHDGGGGEEPLLGREVRGGVPECTPRGEVLVDKEGAVMLKGEGVDFKGMHTYGGGLAHGDEAEGDGAGIDGEGIGLGEVADRAEKSGKLERSTGDGGIESKPLADVAFGGKGETDDGDGGYGGDLEGRQGLTTTCGFGIEEEVSFVEKDSGVGIGKGKWLESGGVEEVFEVKERACVGSE
jgi:hypothetical protein